MTNTAFAITAGIFIGMGAVAVNADQTGVAPPQGSALLLEAAADGAQIYTCEAKGNLFQWSFTAPEANLFDKEGRQIGTHFAGPTWKMADGSAIVGEVIAKADAPEKDAVQWLLLRAKAHDRQGILSDAALYSPDAHQGRGRAHSRLRREPCLRTGAHALLRHLSVFQRAKGLSTGASFPLLPRLPSRLLLAALPLAFAACAHAPEVLVAFRTEQQAQEHCPKDTVIWVDPQSGGYYLNTSSSYGHAGAGRYACRREAEAAGMRAMAN